uniref:F-box domain-containing protein n=2 Tax=Aegilops tauschii subsp. strangulata TaxID=200361 RepID=A0A453TDG8_AEGTS
EAQASLPNHLTEDILLRLPTAADLASASMAGHYLRLIIADHSFLRRFRALHPPPLLGILSDPFFPAQPPHPSAAAARTLTGTDFSCSFLPSREQRWRRCDFRDGRALLCIDTDGGAMVRDVAVCDPLHRRYLLLPPVPQGLPDLVHHLDPFLAPAGGDEGADTDTAAGAPFRFKVMCLAQYHTRLVLHIYSSSGPHAGQWRTVTFDGWAALLAGVSDHARSSAAFGKRYYAHGCFCWAICAINKLLLLDTATTEFSSVNLPPDLMNHQVAFVEASQGRLGMFALSQVPTHLVPRLRYSILVSTGDDDPGRWQKKKVVTLSHDYCYQIIGVAGGYLLLYLVTDNPDSFPPGKVPDPGCFSLNLRTMELERFSRNRDILPLQGQLYSGFPPYLSPPTI